MPHITDEELVSEHVKPVAVHIVGGLLHAWQLRNSAATVPHAIERLRDRRQPGQPQPPAGGRRAAYRGRYPFLDTDLYKTLEGLAYELGRGRRRRARTRSSSTRSSGCSSGVQAEDGYLNSYFQDPVAQEPWEDLAWGHELYNLGHLIQAAVAAAPAARRRAICSTVARRFADLVVRGSARTASEASTGTPRWRWRWSSCIERPANAAY